MNTIKTTFDFLGKNWSLSKHPSGYHFLAYDGDLNIDYKITLYITAKTADGIFKKIQAEINKCGFKVKKAKVAKVKVAKSKMKQQKWPHKPCKNKDCTICARRKRFDQNKSIAIFDKTKQFVWPFVK